MGLKPAQLARVRQPMAIHPPVMLTVINLLHLPQSDHTAVVLLPSIPRRSRDRLRHQIPNATTQVPRIRSNYNKGVNMQQTMYADVRHQAGYTLAAGLLRKYLSLGCRSDIARWARKNTKHNCLQKPNGTCNSAWSYELIPESESRC